MSQLNCAVFSSTGELEATLEQLGHLQVVARTSKLDDLCDVVRRSQPSVLFIDLGEDPDAALDELELLPAPRPLLVVSGPEDDSQVILRAMWLGDVSLFCDLQPHYTLSDLAAERADFDSAYLRTILAPHRSGVQVLAAPKQAEDAECIRPSHLERAVNLFRKDFDWVVMDVSRTWDEINVRALDLADQILLVTSTDVPTLNHARQHLDLLQRLGHSAEKIRVVVNRDSKSGPISSKDVGEFLGRTPDSWVPNDYPTTLKCVNEGKSLWEVAPRSGLSSAYRALAEQTHRWCNAELTVVKPNGGIRGYIQERLLRRGNGTD
jgi:MinD-like ATPase involved in chromosome partitioning or flagellar assembly